MPKVVCFLISAFATREVFAGRIGEDDVVALLAKIGADEETAVCGLDGRLAEEGIDVAIRVEDVFDQPRRAARDDAVEIRADIAAVVAEAVARGAVLRRKAARRGPGRVSLFRKLSCVPR